MLQTARTMDPLSLSSILISLAAKFLSIANCCHTLDEKDKLASVTLRALKRKFRSVNIFLDGINAIILDPRNASTIQNLDLQHWHELLMATTDACRLTHNCLEKGLTELGLLGVQSNNKGANLWRCWRLYWNEDTLESLCTLLDTNIDSVRCLLDVLKAAVLIPVEEQASNSRLSMLASMLQHKLIKADERIGAHFGIPSQGTSGADPWYEHGDENLSVVYSRYRDNVDCIRSTYSRARYKYDDFGLAALASVSNLSELKEDDGCSFTSTALLITHENEKATRWGSERLATNEASDLNAAGLLGSKSTRAEKPRSEKSSPMTEPDSTAPCCPTDNERVEHNSGNAGETPKSMLILDLYQELGMDRALVEARGGPPKPPKGRPRQGGEDLNLLAVGKRSQSQDSSLSKLWSELTSASPTDDGYMSTLETGSGVVNGKTSVEGINFASLNMTVVGRS